MVSPHHVGMKPKGRQPKKKEQTRENAVQRYQAIRQERAFYRQALAVLCLTMAVAVIYGLILGCVSDSRCFDTYVYKRFMGVTGRAQTGFTLIANAFLAVGRVGRSGYNVASATYASLVTDREPAALVRARKIASNGEPAEKLAAQYTLGIMYYVSGRRTSSNPLLPF